MTNTTDTAFDHDRCFAVFTAGRDWATSLKAGDTFRGAYGEALHQGLEDWDARFFVAGAMPELERMTVLLEGHDSDIIHSIKAA